MANERMKQAYDVIKRFSVDRLEDNARRAASSTKHFYQSYVFNSALPDSYLRSPDLNRYFEVMNSAGVSLEPHEVLERQASQEQPDQQLLLKSGICVPDFAASYSETKRLCRWKIIGNPIGTFSIRLAKEPVFRIVDRLKEILRT